MTQKLFDRNNGTTLSFESVVPLILRKKIQAAEATGDVELCFIPQEKLTAAGFPPEKTIVSCQKRQKGEIPGTGTISPENPILSADPVILLGNGKSTLLCGFLETTIHLARWEYSADGIRAFAEYHPAYRPEQAEVYAQKMIFLEGDDPAQLLEEYASAIAEYHHIPEGYRFPRYTVGANWHYYGPTMSESQLAEELSAIKERRIPLDIYQIDDGWEIDYGNWMPNKKWPSGMKYAADIIRNAGMIPGIWITPFLCGETAIADQHPQWLLRDASGNALTMNIGPIPFRIFDPSHPECAKYIKEVLVRIYSWGYRYFKIDFTRCLFINPEAVPFDRTLTLLQLYRKGIELLRETLGSECCLNLCGGHEGATIGLADVTRSGSDTYGNWAKSNGAWTRIQQCVMRNWMTRFRMTDPDASIMRINETPLPEALDFTPHRYVPSYSTLSQGSLNDDEAATFVLNQFLGGGIAEVGERLPDLQSSRLDLLCKVVPGCGTPAQPLDFYTSPLPRFYLTDIQPQCKELPPWKILSVLNISDESADFRCPHPLTETVAAIDTSTLSLLGIFAPGEDIPVSAIPPHGSRVIKLLPLPEKREIIFAATDLHYSSGGVEISGIKKEPDGLHGSLSSPWERRVKVAALIPLSDGKSWKLVTTSTGSNGEFFIPAT